MAIRAGAVGDIPAMAMIVERAHEASIYAHLTFDPKEARKLMLNG